MPAGGPPYAVANIGSPIAQTPVDPVTGSVTVGGVATYTAITTAGTTTLKATPAVFFGLQSVGLGTGFAAVAYDIFGTTTTQIIGTATTSSVGQQLTPAPGVGVRTTGALVVVTSGTAGQINAFWD